MPNVMPSITDRWRNLRNGRKRWTGQVLRFPPRKVLAEVYGDTLEEMRLRKHVVCEALRKLEEADDAND